MPTHIPTVKSIVKTVPICPLANKKALLQIKLQVLVMDIPAFQKA